MANSLDTKFKSSGFSISRIEVLSMQQPLHREYFVGDGVTTAYPLGRHVDVNLQNTLAIRVYNDTTGQSFTLDNVTGDSTFSNGGQFYYTPPAAVTNESFSGVGDQSQTFNGDGSQTTFTVSSFSLANSDEIRVAGVVQVLNTDYTISGSDVVFSTAPANGAAVIVRKPGTATFTVTATISDPADLTVYVNGALLSYNTDFSVSGQNITFANTPSTGTNNISIVIPSASPYGTITLSSTAAPAVNNRLVVDYFPETQYYNEYQDGVMKSIARDLTLHPYANYYTPAWSNFRMSEGTITISYTSNASNASGTATLSGTDAGFVAEDVGKRLVEMYGRGSATITGIQNSDQASITLNSPFTDTENNLETSLVNGTRLAENSWRMTIPAAEIEQQPFNIIYPYAYDGDTSCPTIDENGQQKQQDVMAAIRRIGSRFVVESEKGVDILSSKKDITSSELTLPTDLIASTAYREGRSPQKWRIMFEYNEQNDELNVFAGTQYQIRDDGSLSSTQPRDGIKGPVFRRPGEMSDIYYDSSSGLRKARSGWFRRTGKDDPTITNTYPVKYRLTCTDHGIGLFMWDHASVDQDDDYAWFVIQRHVNNTSGAIELEDGKSPVHCIYSPSKRAVEASNSNVELYQNWVQNTNPVTGRVNIQYDQLGDIYDINGRQLKSTDKVIHQIITQKDRIFAPTAPGLAFGSFENWANADTTLSEVENLTSPGFTVGNEYITASHVSDYCDKSKISTQTDPNVASQAPDIAYLGVDYNDMPNYNNAYQSGIGPSGLGLEIESIYLAQDDPNESFKNYVELEEGVHWELEVQAVENFTNPFDSTTTPVKRFGIKFLHPVVNPTSGQLRQLVIHEINDTDPDWAYEAENTPATPKQRQKPAVLINYRWKGAGYNNKYINAKGASGDGSSPLTDTALLDVFVNNVQINPAIAPEEYALDVKGVPQFTQIPVFGSENNVYVYTTNNDTLYVRDEIANDQVVTISYENYAIDPTASNQYLIQLPEDPDIPSSWANPHTASKGIYRFCIREQDVLKPWDKHVSAITPQTDSPAVINPFEQLALTDQKTLVTFFPTPMTSQRYIYPSSETDLICYTSADSSTMGGFVSVGSGGAKYDLDLVQSSSTTGAAAGTGANSSAPLNHRHVYDWHTGTDSSTTSADRSYLGMHSTQPYGNGMRIMLLVRGGSIRPEYSDFIPPGVS